MGRRRQRAMKSLQVELPEKLSKELEALVRGGWFRSEEEIVRAALVEFIRRHRFELLEKYQREDIAWALQHKGAEE
jgi:Arc/MetJ-type ribon-helix-helix transcriptional regulator